MVVHCFWKRKENINCKTFRILITGLVFGFKIILYMFHFSKALADYSKQFIISVVLGKDLVPRWDFVKLLPCCQTDTYLVLFIYVNACLYLESRFLYFLWVVMLSFWLLFVLVLLPQTNSLLFPFRLSIPNMEDLKRRILKMVSNCSKPKVWLFV